MTGGYGKTQGPSWDLVFMTHCPQVSLSPLQGLMAYLVSGFLGLIHSPFLLGWLLRALVLADGFV